MATSERLGRRAVVLAGGLGTRLRQALPALPKPLAPVAGRPFLEWVLLFLVAQGVTEAIVASGYKADAIADWAKEATIAESLTVKCKAEPRPLGTGGAILHAIADEPTGRPWLVCNGDSLALASLDPLYEELDGWDAMVLGLRQPDCSRYGRLETGGQGRLLRFQEKTPGPGVINAGVYLLSEKLLASVPETRPLSVETQLFPRWLEAGARVGVAEVSAPFLDIGTEASYAQADAFIAANREAFARA